MFKDSVPLNTQFWEQFVRSSCCLKLLHMIAITHAVLFEQSDSPGTWGGWGCSLLLLLQDHYKHTQREPCRVSWKLAHPCDEPLHEKRLISRAVWKWCSLLYSEVTSLCLSPLGLPSYLAHWKHTFLLQLPYGTDITYNPAPALCFLGPCSHFPSSLCVLFLPCSFCTEAHHLLVIMLIISRCRTAPLESRLGSVARMCGYFVLQKASISATPECRQTKKSGEGYGWTWAIIVSPLGSMCFAFSAVPLLRLRSWCRCNVLQLNV